MQGADVLVAGERGSEGRWTPEHKAKEERSRVNVGTGEKLDWKVWPRQRQEQPLGREAGSGGEGGERAAAQVAAVRR